MKKILLRIVSFFNQSVLQLIGDQASRFNGTFFRVKVSAGSGNRLDFQQCTVEKSFISLSGTHNSLTAAKALISNCHITIKGTHNRLFIGENVKLRGAVINLRGDNCAVIIGNRTTFGGIRIVNVGRDNTVQIGEDCLFSDGIELWGSDTHAIYNEKGELVNPERPVLIGNKVWVGSRAIILKGVTIHHGGIVGMGAVVTKDVPERAVVAGNPAKVVKEGVGWTLDY